MHGGPGGGTSGTERGFFDPAKYRIVLIDQRGCGKSTPHAEIEGNTTWDLVSDIEAVRKHLGIEKWLVFGGSWGSTLSITYAITHPEAVTELVLRGIFLLRRKELEWFYQEGASFVYPDAWETYLEAIPEEERGDMMAAYHKRLTSDDPKVQMDVRPGDCPCLPASALARAPSRTVAGAPVAPPVPLTPGSGLAALQARPKPPLPVRAANTSCGPLPPLRTAACRLLAPGAFGRA